MGASDGFGERGRRLWADLKGDALEPSARLLVEEAARIADRLDVLDRVLTSGADWLEFAPVMPDGSVVRVVVTGVLAEARQQQATLKQLLAEVRQNSAISGGKQPQRSVREGVAPGVVDLGAFAATRSPKAAG